MGIYTKADMKDIKKLIRKTKNAVMIRRYNVILLHMKGLNNTQISEMLEIDRKAVGRYVQSYKAGGIDNLIPKKSPGRPCLLNEFQEQELHMTINNNTPEEVGFDGIKNWTAKIACEWVLRKFGISYSVNGMLELFYRLNLSYTRPTYVLAKANPKKQAQFIEDFESIKKTP